MRSDRLISLLLLLQARNPRSARELARLLEVSQRTVYRDVDALSSAGIPIYAERGSLGGIALVDGYAQTLAHLSFEELHALFVASSHPLADLGIIDSDPALRKLASALPERQKRDAEKARSRLLLDQNKWYRSEQPGTILARLREAVWNDRCVRLAYRDRNGTPSDRVVESLGLVSKAGVWYFVAREPGGEPRSFRAERVSHIEPLEQSFERAGFDVGSYWQTSLVTFERPPDAFEATVRRRQPSVEDFDVFDAEIIERSDDGATLRIRFWNVRSALNHALWWGAAVEVVEPHDLRERVLAHSRATVDAYAPLPTSPM